MDYSEKVFHRTQETPWNTIDEEAVVLNLDNGHYYVLNETGRLVWELLDGERNIDQIAQAICDEYDVEKEQALADVIKLAKELAEENLVAEK